MVVNKSKAAFRTIAEVAEELGVGTHVLRFWESKFSQIQPMKRSGGRRYYRPDDVELIRSIKNMLYVEKLTIEGAQKKLKEKGIKALVGEPILDDLFFEPVADVAKVKTDCKILNEIAQELKEIRVQLADSLK